MIIITNGGKVLINGASILQVYLRPIFGNFWDGGIVITIKLNGLPLTIFIVYKRAAVYEY